jgi:transcriptional regulator with XRE-family HTH domain
MSTSTDASLVAKKTIAANLRHFRNMTGISQEKLALDAEVDRTYVSQLERGIANPSLEVLCRLATTLGIELTDLFLNPGRPI